MCKANPTHYFFAFLLLPLLVSCGGKRDAPHAGTFPSGGQFVMLLNDPVETLDPKKIIYKSDWEASFLIYEGLVGYTDSLNRLEPLLAEHWEVLDGGHTLRFHLRKNVRFHDNPCFPDGRGRTVVADDVAFMLERLADPAEPGYYYGLFGNMIAGLADYHSGSSPSISGFVALDEHTIEIQLHKPFAVFLKLLATPAAYIIPREATEFYGTDFHRNPVGTGPFQLAVWKPIEELIFIRNHHYWGRDSNGNRLPWLDSVTMRIATADTDHLSEFLKGNTHKLVLRKHELEPLLREPHFSDAYHTHENKIALGTRFFGIRSGTGHAFDRDATLRRAVAGRFYRSFAERETNDGLVISHTFVPPLLLGNPPFTSGPSSPSDIRQPAIPVADIKDPSHPHARALGTQEEELDGSPHPDADHFTLDDRPLILAASIDSEDLQHLAKTMDAMGIPTEKVVRPDNYYKYIIDGEPDIFRVSMTPSFPDPTDYYSLFYSGSPPNLNLMGYHNPVFDALFEQSMTEMDPDARSALHLQMEKIISEDVPVLLISHAMPDYIVMPADITGFIQRHLFPDYRHIRFSSTEHSQP